MSTKKIFLIRVIPYLDYVLKISHLPLLLQALNALLNTSADVHVWPGYIYLANN